MSKVSIVLWLPNSTTHYLATEELKCCTAIGIICPTAAVLAYIALREPGRSIGQPLGTLCRGANLRLSCNVSRTT